METSYFVMYLKRIKRHLNACGVLAIITHNRTPINICFEYFKNVRVWIVQLAETSMRNSSLDQMLMRIYKVGENILSAYTEKMIGV